MNSKNDIRQSILKTLQSSLSSTQVTTEAFKDGLRDTIAQITRGYRVTMYMYLAVFLLGVGLIGLSAYLAIAKEREIVSWLFGGMGMASVLSFFFSKTPIQLQKSRTNLAQLQAAYSIGL